MDRYDLTKQSDRLALAEFAFTYPAEPHRRKHRPAGYKTYESYREWLRDEFSYRCVFSLVRETWDNWSCTFDIDHLESQSSRPDLICEYDNLLYVTHRMNLNRGKRTIPDPSQIALGSCLRVTTHGQRVGCVETLNEIGERIVSVFKLNSEKAVDYRTKLLEILRSQAINDEKEFRRMIGFPTALPDLRKKKATKNTRPDGLEKSAHFLRESGNLPEWY